MFGLIRGALYPFRGLRMILRDRRLLGLCAAPVLLGLILYLALGWVLFTRVGVWFEHLWPHVHDRGVAAWLGESVRFVVSALVWLLVLLVAILSFVKVTQIVAAPFLDRISLRTERLLDRSFQERVGGTSVLREMWAEIKRLFVGLALWIVCLAANLVVPGSGAAAGLLLAVYFIGQDFLSYPMDRRVLDRRSRRRFLSTHRGTVWGFSTAAFALLFVPVASLLVVPSCVVGGTLLFWESTRPRPPA
jgi:CysZ protein